MSDDQNPDAEGFIPLRQYIDLRGQIFLRSADRKWLGWNPPRRAFGSEEMLPGNWYLCGQRDSSWGMYGQGREGHDPTLPVMPVRMVETDAEVSA